MQARESVIKLLLLLLLSLLFLPHQKVEALLSLTRCNDCCLLRGLMRPLALIRQHETWQDSCHSEAFPELIMTATYSSMAKYKYLVCVKNEGCNI